jgi:outer membrane lipoprotein LolB
VSALRNRVLVTVAALILPTLLTACATRSARDDGPAVVDLSLEARAEALANQAAHETILGGENAAQRCRNAAWRLEGRIALSNGRDGGSGRLEWEQQAGGAYSVALSAPVTRQSWRLSGDTTGAARLEGLDGGPRSGADAANLLRETTGWTIPVDALGCWVVGMRAAEPQHGAAALGFDDALRLVRIEQGGWRIDYAEWQPFAALNTALPRRLTARRGNDEVRLVIDLWAAPEPGPHSSPPVRQTPSR